MALISGEDGIWGSCYSFEHFNRIKNNFSQDAPQEGVILTDPQPGMTVSDNVDNRLYHKLVAAGFAELLQAGGVVTYENDVVCYEGEVVTCGI